MKRTVYNLETGQAATVDGIDAREYVATGGWSFEPPPPVDPGPPAPPEETEPTAPVDPAPPEETGKKAKK